MKSDDIVIGGILSQSFDQLRHIYIVFEEINNELQKMSKIEKNKQIKNYIQDQINFFAKRTNNVYSRVKGQSQKNTDKLQMVLDKEMDKMVQLNAIDENTEVMVEEVKEVDD